MGYNKEEIREKFKVLFEYSLDFIFVHDLKGNFLDANEIALTALGYEREEIPNISFLNLIDEAQLKRAFERVNRLLKEGRHDTQAEYKIITKDENLLYLETYSIPLRKEGKIYAILGIGKNITERKVTELYLKESEEKFRTLYEYSPFAILLIDLKGIVLDCNPITIKMFGYDKKEIVGKEIRNLEAIRPEDLPILLNLFKKLIGGEKLQRIEIQLKKKDGSIGWAYMQAIIFEIEGEKFVQAILHEYGESTIIGQTKS